MQIYEVTDPLFKEYGKIIDSVELTGLLAEMKHTPVPEDVVYVASEPKLEALAVMKELRTKPMASFRSRSAIATVITGN